MDNKHHPIYSLDWEMDIPNNPVWSGPMIIKDNIENIPLENIFLGIQPRITENDLLVQADPNDLLSFNDVVQKSKRHHATTKTWMRTIDRYLYQYRVLVMQRDADKNRYILMPDTMADKYQANIKRERRGETRFGANVDFFQLQMVDDGKRDRSLKMQTPRYAAAAYINQLFREICVNRNAKNIRRSFVFDGVKHWEEDWVEERAEDRKEDREGHIPKFNLEDYIEHELTTGISLSLEVTSVLLEIENIDLRGKALCAFEENALPIIVQSPLLFTRNAVARYFFLQIIKEMHMREYRWNANVASYMFDEEEWDDLIVRATQHAEILKPRVDWIKVPDEDVDSAIEHILRLLSMVEIPVNLPKYVNEPQYGLAAFCHPWHKNIDYFLQELKIQDKKKCGKGPAIRYRNEENNWFIKVQKCVKDAIKRKSF